MWGCEDVRNEVTGWMRGRRHTEGKERESDEDGRQRKGEGRRDIRTYLSRA